MIQKVDPVHFFNALGESLLTMGYQGEVIDRLFEENAELKRLLKAALLRLGENTNKPAQEEHDQLNSSALETKLARRELCSFGLLTDATAPYVTLARSLRVLPLR